MESGDINNGNNTGGISRFDWTKSNIGRFYKVTCKNDDEVNKFFEDHPGIAIIKFVIARGEQHIIYAMDWKYYGKQHLQTHTMKKMAGIIVAKETGV